MAEQLGEKTELPTARRLEEASQRGQFPRSPEIQTTAVLLAGMFALVFAGHDVWRNLVVAFTGTLGHLHGFAPTVDAMQDYAIKSVLVIAQCVAPIVLATGVAGLVVGAAQSRFQTASEALEFKWERLDPIAGIKRLFSMRSAPPTLVAIVKLTAIIALTYGQVRSVLNDPIFATPISAARLGEFIAQTSLAIVGRVALAMLVIAAADYGYQYWRVSQDLMMTKGEVQDEAKNTEGNPKMKARLRRRRQRASQRNLLRDIPQADVVVTNPTHLAIALRYDRKTMRAPRIVAKGSRLNALRIREIARQHQVPVLENKPLARLMFKYGQVGGEIPAQLYAAVAEILAWVYRTNRYKYYAERNQTQ